MGTLGTLILQQPRAVSLVVLLLLSLGVAYVFGAIAVPGLRATKLMYLQLQAVMGACGLAAVFWPSFAYVAVLLSIAGCGMLLYRTHRQNRKRRVIIA